MKYIYEILQTPSNKKGVKYRPLTDIFLKLSYSRRWIHVSAYTTSVPPNIFALSPVGYTHYLPDVCYKRLLHYPIAQQINYLHVWQLISEVDNIKLYRLFVIRLMRFGPHSIMIMHEIIII